MPKYVTITLVSALVVLSSQAALAVPAPSNGNPNQPNINGAPAQVVAPDGSQGNPCIPNDATPTINAAGQIVYPQDQPFNILDCI